LRGRVSSFSFLAAFLHGRVAFFMGHSSLARSGRFAD
jgi:hypothetical protein